jgi:hypothetical protein
MSLTDADIAYLKDAPVTELQEELRYANPDDFEYRRALCDEIIKRAKTRRDDNDRL